jgi:hypothetical protein
LGGRERELESNERIGRVVDMKRRVGSIGLKARR